MPVGLDKVLIQFYTLFYLFNLSYEDLIMPIKIHRISILKLHGIPWFRAWTDLLDPLAT